MRIDELTRALHREAEEAMAASPVGMAGLRARRTRARRRLTVTAAAAATLVAVAGVSWLGGTPPGPRNDPAGPTTSTAPSPSPTPSQNDVSSWEALRCNTPDLGGCEVPQTLTYDGRTYTQLGGAGGSQPVHAGNGLNRELGLSVVPTGGRVLVLAGATGTGPGSRLTVSVNWAPDVPVPSGPLTALLLRETPDSQKVVVQEVGAPARDETLRIATYSPAG